MNIIVIPLSLLGFKSIIYMPLPFEAFAKGTHQTAAYSRERIVLSAKIPNTLQSRSLFVAIQLRAGRAALG